MTDDGACRHLSFTAALAIPSESEYGRPRHRRWQVGFAGSGVCVIRTGNTAVANEPRPLDEAQCRSVAGAALQDLHVVQRRACCCVAQSAWRRRNAGMSR